MAISSGHLCALHEIRIPTKFTDWLMSPPEELRGHDVPRMAEADRTENSPAKRAVNMQVRVPSKQRTSSDDIYSRVTITADTRCALRHRALQHRPLSKTVRKNIKY